MEQFEDILESWFNEWWLAHESNVVKKKDVSSTNDDIPF